MDCILQIVLLADLWLHSLEKVSIYLQNKDGFKERLGISGNQIYQP